MTDTQSQLDRLRELLACPKRTPMVTLHQDILRSLLDENERLKGALEEIIATLGGSSEWPDIDVRALAIARAALNPKEQTDAK